MMRLPHAENVLRRGLDESAFSAVAAEIGDSSKPLWTYSGGTLAFADASPPVSDATIFDLASLTKVLSTSTLALTLCARELLDVDWEVRRVIDEWQAADRLAVTIRDLLEHCSGLPAHRDYFLRMSGREAFAHAIAAEPLDYAPRARSIYSDLGFIILGFAIERIAGDTLDRQFDTWRGKNAVAPPLAYLPPHDWVSLTAKTEDDPWRGRVLQGEVHDENTAALGGVAAHAGLFGTAARVGDVARWWLALLGGREIDGIAPALAREFVRRSAVPGSSRALGWDTMLPTSSCGTRMSARAVGHTGFTGTSLWLDPEQDRYFVLLTNRVHPTRTNNTIQPIRRAFHDAAINDLTGG